MVTDWSPFPVLDGVLEHEVIQALQGRRWPRPVQTDMGLAIGILGETNIGRVVFVVLRKTGQFDQQIVAAREATAGERAEFLAWKAGQ